MLTSLRDSETDQTKLELFGSSHHINKLMHIGVGLFLFLRHSVQSLMSDDLMIVDYFIKED